MATPPPVELVDHVRDALDDGQLRIRIPNPKVYMARQSQWVGRRGKPRCDYCRINNLKCDRLLPVCNHCSWANQDCKYTPLPTPAHRGIPRCDRCREANLKCDRNLPICNNCKEASDLGAPCNYTPKKRNKIASEEAVEKPPLTKIGPKILPKGSDPKVKIEQVDSTGHTFYGLNVAFPLQETSRSSSASGMDQQSDQDSSHTGRFTVDPAKGREAESGSRSQESSENTAPPLQFISHPLPQNQKNSAHLEPWSHPSFMSLPKFVVQRLRQVDSVEMPKRQNFDNALYTFQNGMMEALRETACLFVDKYTKLARYLVSGDTSTVSARVQSWAAMHRLCSGSEKYNVILAPRDAVYSMDEATAEMHKIQFVNEFLNATTEGDDLQISHFDVLPVREQLYDILTYAHRSHLPASQMLLEVIRLKYPYDIQAFVTWPMAEMYVKMCPLCNMRKKQQERIQTVANLPKST
ncbi:hypothetical protein CVT26_015699 [Gymnopilus dilepis]|uniref:Zn(2)-C6 fungal-type domain-containing protein n=1 Tax=Gymnopilus dilepis TaxID=231916 RepID=A0A409VFG2_9AGAR|nr:hypothetical protein CVT26_015699 [Gymnopilus dilepis]